MDDIQSSQPWACLFRMDDIQSINNSPKSLRLSLFSCLETGRWASSTGSCCIGVVNISTACGVLEANSMSHLSPSMLWALPTPAVATPVAAATLAPRQALPLCHSAHLSLWLFCPTFHFLSFSLARTVWVCFACSIKLLLCSWIESRTTISLSGKNLANNGHSSYKCRRFAEPPEASAAVFWRVLARRKATLREFSAVFLSFYTFQNYAFEGYMFDVRKIIVATWWKVGWTSEIPTKLWNTNKTLISFTKF